MASATVQLKVRPEDLSQVPKAGERIPDPGIMVIFGASGDLTKRKLLPSLFHLEQDSLLPKNFAIVGVARRPLGNEFAEDMRQGIVEFGGVKADDPKLDEFIKKVSYYALSFDDASHYAGVNAELDRIAPKRTSVLTACSISRRRRSTSRPSSRILAHRVWRSRKKAASEW